MNIKKLFLTILIISSIIFISCKNGVNLFDPEIISSTKQSVGNDGYMLNNHFYKYVPDQPGKTNYILGHAFNGGEKYKRWYGCDTNKPSLLSYFFDIPDNYYSYNNTSKLLLTYDYTDFQSNNWYEKGLHISFAVLSDDGNTFYGKVFKKVNNENGGIWSNNRYRDEKYVTGDGSGDEIRLIIDVYNLSSNNILYLREYRDTTGNTDGNDITTNFDYNATGYWEFTGSKYLVAIQHYSGVFQTNYFSKVTISGNEYMYYNETQYIEKFIKDTDY